MRPCANYRDRFRNCNVVANIEYAGKKIVITENAPFGYFWYVCSPEYEVLSDNTEGYGFPSEEHAIVIAKRVIDDFSGIDE